MRLRGLERARELRPHSGGAPRTSCFGLLCGPIKAKHRPNAHALLKRGRTDDELWKEKHSTANMAGPLIAHEGTGQLYHNELDSKYMDSKVLSVRIIF